MTRIEFEQALEAVGMTKSSYARYIKVHPRSVCRWSAHGVPEVVRLHLEAMLRLQQTADWVSQK